MPKKDALKYELGDAVLEIVGAVILVMDSHGQILRFNKACENLTGYKFKEVYRKYPWDLFVLPDEIERVKNVFSRLKAGDFPNSHTNYWTTKNKGMRLIQWSNTSILDADGNVAYVIATGIDITEQKEAEDKLIQHQQELEQEVAERTKELHAANQLLEEIARQDELTGLYNRRHFNKMLDIEIRRSVREKIPLSLIMCDVDYFKSFNDYYGHVAGDECLREIADVLKQEFRRSADIVARFGGEEFVVILPDVNQEEAFFLAHRLLESVRNKNIAHDSSPIENRVTISLGLATMNTNKVYSMETIIGAADHALYMAKNKGRNRVEFTPENQVQKYETINI